MRDDQGIADRLSRSLAARPTTPNDREFHEDLRTLSTAELCREGRRLSFAVHLSMRPARWARQRLLLVELELRRRHAL